MSASHLPQDFRHWPTDPHELLGVSASADTKSLRRAYTALIRQFKPEQHPEQFQKIRAAYEQAKSWASFTSQFETVDDWADDSAAEPSESADDLSDNSRQDDSGPADDIVDVDGMEVDDTPSSHPQPTASRSDNSPVDEQDLAATAWQRILAGDVQSGYVQLRKLQGQVHFQEDDWLRLYWTLRLRPDLDRTREPGDWLVAALKAGGLRGRVFQLLLQELLEQLEFAKSEGVWSLLMPGDNPERLAELLVGRIRALATLNRPDLIEVTLQRGRSLLLPDDADSWITVLAGTIEQISCFPLTQFTSLSETIRKELATFEDRHIDSPYLFDQAEFAFLLGEDAKFLINCHVPAEYDGRVWQLTRESVAADLRQDGTSVRELLLKLVKCFAENPQRASRSLNVYYGDRSLPVFGRLPELLARYLGTPLRRGVALSVQHNIRRKLSLWAGDFTVLDEDVDQPMHRIVEECLALGVTLEDLQELVIEMLNDPAETSGRLQRMFNVWLEQPRWRTTVLCLHAYWDHVTGEE